MSFKKGDRVKRKVGLEIYKIGTVIKRYSAKARTIADVTLGPYPELYAVKWEGTGRVEKGFLPHGIEPLINQPATE